MKAFTDLEQSKKLAKILPLESADMYYEPAVSFCTEPSEPRFGDIKYAHPRSVPCWSLAALLNILPNYHVTNNGITGVVVWSLDTYSKEHDSPVDACYEMIVRLNELNLL